MTNEQKEYIDELSHFEICRLWRFTPIGDPLFTGDTGDYLTTKFHSLGGLTPAISKKLGWGGPFSGYEKL